MPILTEFVINEFNCISYSSIEFVPVFQCFQREFGCTDGKCIPIEKRCDGVADCKDYFDENNCEMVIIDKNRYQKEYPPLQADGTETIIKITVDLLSIGSFEEIAMTFSVKFYIMLEWYVILSF